jgi:hypothetical protein
MRSTKDYKEPIKASSSGAFPIYARMSPYESGRFRTFNYCGGPP